MERLKNIKRPPLKDKFKKFGDTFEFVSKMKTTECTATEEPPRKGLYILRCSGRT